MAGDKKTIRGSTVEVRRIASHLFDYLLFKGQLSQQQHRAAIWAMAKHRAGAFLPRVVAKYGPRLHNDHDELIDDSDSDPAAEWRLVALGLSYGPSRVLESVLLGAGLAPSELPELLAALDEISKVYLNGRSRAA